MKKPLKAKTPQGTRFSDCLTWPQAAQIATKRLSDDRKVMQPAAFGYGLEAQQPCGCLEREPLNGNHLDSAPVTRVDPDRGSRHTQPGGQESDEGVVCRAVHRRCRHTHLESVAV